MDTREQRMARRVASRLTRAPITDAEVDIVAILAPGKHARWITGGSKRFLRDLVAVLDFRDVTLPAPVLSDRQRAWLWRLAWVYRHRLPVTLRRIARERREWVTTVLGRRPPMTAIEELDEP